MLCFRCGSYNPENAQKCSVCGQGFIDEAGKAVGPPRRESKTTQPASIFVPGELVAGRYRIGELLGQGGVGAVYKARDLEIDVDIALKGITPNLLQTEEEQANFSKQIKSARKLQHPNIVRIYDEGHEGNRRFFTMKLLEGLTLRKIIRLRHEKGQPFSAEELVPIFHQLAAALDYAHKTTWHGDLKPENVIILPDLLKVTDFNLVKGLPLKPFLGIAKSRSKGFPYIAPELRVEAQTIDGRCDIYALGVILAEMLTGLVFEGHYTRAMTAALEQLPTKLDGLVRKAVTEHPDGRYQRGSDLAKELEAALGAMTAPLPPPAKVTMTGPGAPRAATPAVVAHGGGPPRSQPPPPPAETGPSHSPAPMLSSDDITAGGVDLDSEEQRREPSEIVEIGQSQVLLLASGVTQQPPEMLAEAARRLMAVASSAPDDTLDEGTEGAGSDIDTTPRGTPVRKEMPAMMQQNAPRPGFVSSVERPRDPAQMLEALWQGDEKDALRPPPLPGIDQPDTLDNSLDARVPLPGDDNSEDEPTDERRAITTAEPPSAENNNDNGQAHEIHDALTALKPHPPELMDDEVRAKHETDLRRKMQQAQQPQPGTDNKERTDKVQRRPPPLDDEAESLKETLSADVLRAAKERSSPSLHRAEALPPPVVAPPPVLRPVAPPKRQGGGPPMGLVVGAIGVLAVLSLLILWRAFTNLNAGGEKPLDPADRAVVTPGTPDDPVVAVAPDAGPLVVDVAPPSVLPLVDLAAPPSGEPLVKPDEPVVVKRPDEPVVVVKKPDEPVVVVKKPDEPVDDEPVDDKKPDDKKPDDKKPDDKKPEDAVVVAAAVAQTSCPSGMVLVEAGAFTFGSAGGDLMRNFGEAAAASVEMKAFCIQYYEHPNGKSSIPTTKVSWQGAKTACERSGARLCSEREWERACKGPSSLRFPYGNGYEVDVCNTEDADGKPRALAPATAFKRCRSAFKVFMMAGNAEEWVNDSINGQKIAKGGASDRPDFASRCAARRSLAARTTTDTLGFRCCADPK